MLKMAPAFTAFVILAVPAAEAHATDVTKSAGNMIYNMVGAMLVESATKGGDIGINANGPYIPQDRYAAADALNNQSFGPAEGVNCYPKQQLCFKSNGKPDVKWTNRIYGN